MKREDIIKKKIFFFEVFLSFSFLIMIIIFMKAWKDVCTKTITTTKEKMKVVPVQNNPSFSFSLCLLVSYINILIIV